MIRYLIKNNFKLMVRSITNSIMIVIAPLILILLLSSAFNETMSRYDNDSDIVAGYMIEGNDVSNEMIEALLSGQLLNMNKGCFKIKGEDHGVVMGVWMCFTLNNENKTITAARSEVKFASMEAESPFENRTAVYTITDMYPHESLEKVYKVRMVGVSATAVCLSDEMVEAANTNSWYGYNDWVKDTPKDIAGKHQTPESQEVFLTVGLEEEQYIKIEDKDHIRVMELDENKNLVDTNIVLTFEATAE